MNCHPSTHAKSNYKAVAKSYLFHRHNHFPCQMNHEMMSVKGKSFMPIQIRTASQLNGYEHCFYHEDMGLNAASENYRTFGFL